MTARRVSRRAIRILADGIGFSMSALSWDGHVGFFTPLRCVQNDSGGLLSKWGNS